MTLSKKINYILDNRNGNVYKVTPRLDLPGYWRVKPIKVKTWAVGIISDGNMRSNIRIKGWSILKGSHILKRVI